MPASVTSDQRHVTMRSSESGCFSSFLSSMLQTKSEQTSGVEMWKISNIFIVMLGITHTLFSVS